MKFEVFDKNKWNGKKILLYGAGNIGMQAYRYFIEHNFKKEDLGFVDRSPRVVENYKKSSDNLGGGDYRGVANNTGGIEVEYVSPQDLQNRLDENVILCSTSYAVEMYKYCKSLVFNQIYSMSDDMFVDNIIQERIRYRFICHNIEKELILPNIGLSVTDKCSLRCKECIALIPYIEKPMNFDENIVIESFKKFLDAIDGVGTVGIMGGEPFIHQKLVRKILRDFGTNPKVGRYVIVTNGTIMPDQETIDVMAKLKERCEVNFSHYGDLSRKESEVIALLEKFGINYDISSPRVWYKQGELKDYNRTDKENQQLFFECNVRLGCSMLNEGELHICTRSSTGARMGKIPKTVGEYVNCYNQNDIAVLREEIAALVNRQKFITACAYCNVDRKILVPVAEQL